MAEIDRRKFLTGTAGLVSGALLGLQESASASPETPASSSVRHKGRPVALLYNPEDPVVASPPAQWALGQVEKAMKARAVPVRRCTQGRQVRADERILAASSDRNALNSYSPQLSS